MSDQDQPSQQSRETVPDPDGSADLTGHPVVDEVLSSLTGLDAQPADEHVAVFESAHERLRAALADAGDPSAPAPAPTPAPAPR